MTYRNVGESGIANAAIRAHGIFAMTVLSANTFVILLINVDVALVDVDALLVGTENVTDRTLAVIAT